MVEQKTAEQYREDARRSLDRERESFERCDTDGFVSQWCHSWSARESEKKAEILENGGKALFVGLYEGKRRVKAKLVETQFGETWVLHQDEKTLIAKRGKPFIPRKPYGGKSRIQRSLGLEEHEEMVPAWCKLDGSGKGFSGLSTLFINVFRTGCPWGSDAVQGEVWDPARKYGDQPGE